MESKNKEKEFISATKYAFMLRLSVSYSQTSVPNIGIVFGNIELATVCHEYISKNYNGDQLKIVITPGIVTASVELKEIDTDKTVFVVELNYDKAELFAFKSKTSTTGRIALIFGFKHGCDYYVTGTKDDDAEKFSPVILTGVTINE